MHYGKLLVRTIIVTVFPQHVQRRTAHPAVQQHFQRLFVHEMRNPDQLYQLSYQHAWVATPRILEWGIWQFPVTLSLSVPWDWPPLSLTENQLNSIRKFVFEDVQGRLAVSGKPIIAGQPMRAYIKEAKQIRIEGTTTDEERKKIDEQLSRFLNPSIQQVLREAKRSEAEPQSDNPPGDPPAADHENPGS